MKFILLQSLEAITPQSLKHLSLKLIDLVESKLWVKILLAMFLGLILGILTSSEGPFKEFVSVYHQSIQTALSWLALPAKFFLKLIQMVIIPLILASIIRGLATSKDAKQMKKMGTRFGIFVLSTSIIASILAIVLCQIIQPGSDLNLDAPKLKNSVEPILDISLFNPELFSNFLPTNPLASIVEGQMLEVVILAIIGGIALLSIDIKQTKIILDFLEVIQNIAMTIIAWAMKLAPYAVFGMIAQITSSTGVRALSSMGQYVLTTFIGFSLFILFYTILILLLKKISPLTYFKKISTPMLLAFSTSSSAATMPITIKVAEEDLKIKPSIAGFLIPLGTTVNMAGSAIWQTCAVVFIAQAYNVDLSYGQIAFVVATSVGSAIGSPGVPGVGIGVLATVLLKIGIPAEGVSLIFGVDRLVDMGCTVVNVAGDLTASTLMNED